MCLIIVYKQVPCGERQGSLHQIPSMVYIDDLDSAPLQLVHLMNEYGTRSSNLIGNFDAIIGFISGEIQ